MVSVSIHSVVDGISLFPQEFPGNSCWFLTLRLRPFHLHIPTPAKACVVPSHLPTKSHGSDTHCFRAWKPALQPRSGAALDLLTDRVQILEIYREQD